MHEAGQAPGARHRIGGPRRLQSSVFHSGRASAREAGPPCLALAPSGSALPTPSLPCTRGHDMRLGRASAGGRRGRVSATSGAMATNGRSHSCQLFVVCLLSRSWEATADGNCGQAGEGGDWKGRKYPREVTLGCPDGAAITGITCDARARAHTHTPRVSPCTHSHSLTRLCETGSRPTGCRLGSAVDPIR